MTTIWNRFTAWLASKGGAAHVIAAIYVFLVLAYANVPAFHLLVLNVHQALPAWLQELVTTTIALVAFYKTWSGGGSTKSASAAISTVLIAALSLGTLGMLSGCTPGEKQTASALVSTLGTAVGALETLEGNASAAQQIQKDTATAAAQIQAWTSGSTTQNISEALGIVQSDIGLLPVSNADQALIDLALGTVQELLNLFPSTSAPANATIAHPVRAVHLSAKVKSRGDFVKRWNALVVQQPKLAAAQLK